MTEIDRRARFAYALREAMWQRDMSAPELARAIGRSPDTVRRWLKRKATPNSLDLEPMAKALRVDEELFAKPPPIPHYPLDHYLLERVGAVAEEALQSRRRQIPEQSDQPAPERPELRSPGPRRLEPDLQPE